MYSCMDLGAVSPKARHVCVAERRVYRYLLQLIRCVNVAIKLSEAES